MSPCVLTHEDERRLWARSVTREEHDEWFRENGVAKPLPPPPVRLRIHKKKTSAAMDPQERITRMLSQMGEKGSGGRSQANRRRR